MCFKQIYSFSLISSRLLLCMNILLVVIVTPVQAESLKQVTIGVLAHRGIEKATKMWLPTVRYLESEIESYKFDLRLLTLKEMTKAVKNDELDFILTNTGHYVNLEALYGITRVATLKNMRQGKPYTEFGAVVFVRSDRDDIKKLSDLENKSFAAVSKKAFGGFQMAWRELKHAGVDPFKDFSRLEFMGFPQDNIVKSVRDGIIDAGTVRTDTLERMIKSGEINENDFRILNPKRTTGFPFLHSTSLYPEWPFARARNTDDAFATQVVIALLSLSPENAVSKAGLNAGWTVPLSYQSVHDIFSELKIGPYAQSGKITITQILKQYRYWLMMFAAIIVFVAYHIVRVERLVVKRTSELSTSNLALEKAIDESHKNEKNANNLKDNLQLLMNSTAEAILGIDKEGVCTFANRNCFQLLGYPSEKELLGNKIEDLLQIRRENTALGKLKKAALMSAIEHGKSLHADDEICYCKDDKSFPVEYWLHPIEKEDENEGYVISFIDISKRKMIDAELTEHREHLAELVAERTAELHQSNKDLKNNILMLEKTQTQLVQSEKMASLGSLVAGFSHEINTPLGIGVTSATNIQEEVSNLKHKFDSGEMKRSNLESFIEHVKQGSEILLQNLQRASELIRGFKQVAVDQSSDEWRLVDLNEYIDEVILSLKPKWKHSGVKVINECEPELKIYSHPGAIYQIVSNLVINSLIYAFNKDQAGEVCIKVKRENNFVRMDLSDNGKGISDEHIKKIFDPFFTTRRGSGGSGLGLHIVYNLVTGTLLGSITCSSSSTDGTVFHIQFPYKTETTA